MTYEEETKLASWEGKVRVLVAQAVRDGVIITVEQWPNQPLRMGGYNTVVSARLVRVLDTPIKRGAENE